MTFAWTTRRSRLIDAAVRLAVPALWPRLHADWGSVSNTLQALAYRSTVTGQDWVGQSLAHEVRNQFRQLAKIDAQEQD